MHAKLNVSFCWEINVYDKLLLQGYIEAKLLGWEVFKMVCLAKDGEKNKAA
jgi:hypothetical protein